MIYNIPDGFGAGTYTYYISFYDSNGNFVTDSVEFIVQEPPKPTIPGFTVPFVLAIAGSTIAVTVLVLKKKHKT